jgi:hypothetical protein
MAAALAAACGGRDDLALASASSPEDTGGGAAVWASPPPPAASDDATAAFAACTADADCVAVPQVGCCHLGRKVAVARDQEHAYASSFVCPNPAPVCIEILIIDNRTPQCNFDTGRCELVQAPRTACGASPPCDGNTTCGLAPGSVTPACM